jgi:hypothetical protein
MHGHRSVCHDRVEERERERERERNHRIHITEEALANFAVAVAVAQ